VLEWTWNGVEAHLVPPHSIRQSMGGAMIQTDMYEGMLAETITIHGAGGDIVNAYFAGPWARGPSPA
jgi:hypothetical protein